MAMLRETPMFEGRRAPLLVEPLVAGRELAPALLEESDWLGDRLLRHGAVLFRNFEVRGVEDFDAFVSAVSTRRMGYVYGSSPRSSLGDRIFTSTEHPPDLPIELHNECAYQRTWPLRVAFCCLEAAPHGGETPIADMRLVTETLGAEIVDRFESLGVRYVRHFHPYVDVPWQKVFRTDDRETLARICTERDIQFEWLGEQLLRTEQTCQGAARHPVTGERLFFNQAHLFHVSSLGNDDEASLVELFGYERLPKHAYYGDGAEIARHDLSTVRAAFDAAAVSFAWQAGDILLLDNMQVAHGRRPFKGNRRVIAALLDPYPNGAERDDDEQG